MLKKTTWTGFQPIRERVYQVTIYQNMEQPYSFFYIARMCLIGIRILKNNTARKSLDYVYGIWQYKGHVFKIMQQNKGRTWTERGYIWKYKWKICIPLS